jgi:hypothetical protein
MNRTAVEWLVSTLQKADWIPSDSIIMNMIIETAIEKEKRQILDACNQTEFEDIDGMGIHGTIKKGEQYYNETFKNK